MPRRHNMELAVIGSTRIGRDISHPVNERIGAALTFNLGKHFALAPTYYYIAAQPLAYYHSHENRILLDASVDSSWIGFTLTNRVRIERRFRDIGNATRFRDRLQVERPVKLGPHSIRLFVSDEIQHDWSLRAWDRNRFAVGGQKELNKHYSIDLYYLHQNDRHSRPGDFHVMGATLRIGLAEH